MPALRQLLADGEIDIAFSFNPNDASAEIERGNLRDTVRTYMLAGGTIGNTHFVADSPERITQAVSQLLTDPELGRTVARNARNMVAEKFCWKTVMDALDRVVREVVQSDR